MEASRAATGILEVLATRQVRFITPISLPLAWQQQSQVKKDCGYAGKISRAGIQSAGKNVSTHLHLELWEIRQHLGHLVTALTAADVDNAVRVCVLGQGLHGTTGRDK